MASIYHIETDIQCIVLHYGKEICIATPGEDSYLELRKGRHKLTFISTENAADKYSILYEVPENDIEDCICIELSSIKEERLKIEDKAEKLKQELEQKRREEEKQKQMLRLKEIEEEQKMEEQRLRNEKERSEREKEKKQHAFRLAEALHFAERYEKECIVPMLAFEKMKNSAIREEYKLEEKRREKFSFAERMNEVYEPIHLYSEGLRVVKGKNGKYGYVDYDGKQAIDCKYSMAYPFSYGLAHVVDTRYYYTEEKRTYISALIGSFPQTVKENLRHEINEHYFINKNGEIVFSIDGSYSKVGSFCQGIVICARVRVYGVHLNGFNVKGEQVFSFSFGTEIKNDNQTFSLLTDFGDIYVCHSIIKLGLRAFIDLSGNIHFLKDLLIRPTSSKPWSEKYVRLPSERGVQLWNDNGWIDEDGNVYESKDELLKVRNWRRRRICICLRRRGALRARLRHRQELCSSSRQHSSPSVPSSYPSKWRGRGGC